MPKASKREEKRSSKVETTEPPKSASTIHFSTQFAPGRFLVYSRFNKQDLVHIREYAVIGDRAYPTKKGVCFTPGRLRALLNVIEEIDEHRKQQNAKVFYKVQQITYKTYIGAGIYATVDDKFDGVDLRRYWLPEGKVETVPTKAGIYLPSTQWEALKEKLQELMIVRPELTLAEGCLHQNQMSMDCRECSPFASFSEIFGL